MKKENLNLLNNPKVVQWCYEPITSFSLLNTSKKTNLEIAKKEEDFWGNKIIGTTDYVQWTTKLCQDLTIEALSCLERKNVKRAKSMHSSIRDKNYEPDVECDDYIYEVKGRNWSTPGTAGEKILGTPLKYGELPRLYKKPLQIILVGYQEYEAKKGFAFGDLLDKNNQTPELQESLAFYKEQEIEYIAFTDILKKIGLPYGCWNKK